MAKKFCIATTYTSDFSDIGDYCAMTVRHLAMRFGHDYHVDSDISISRPPAWHRVMLAQELLTRGYEAIFWIDADALFCRFDIDPFSPLAERDADWFMVQHAHPGFLDPVPNTGVMIIRNTDWSREFLRRIWSAERFIHHNWWENAATIDLLGYHRLLGEGDHAPNQEIIKHITFLSDAWNYIPSICKDNSQPIIKHYAGTANEERRKMLPREAMKSLFMALEPDKEIREMQEGLITQTYRKIVDRFKRP